VPASPTRSGWIRSTLPSKTTAPKGTIYLWVPVPGGHTSASFSELVLNQADVVVSPGAAYGPSGEGYVRFSLTVPDARLDPRRPARCAQCALRAIEHADCGPLLSKAARCAAPAAPSTDHDRSHPVERAHLSFKVLNAAMAQMTDTIQKRTMICGSG